MNKKALKVRTAIFFSILMCFTSVTSLAATFDEKFYVLINSWANLPQSRVEAQWQDMVDTFADKAYIDVGYANGVFYMGNESSMGDQNYSFDPSFLNIQLETTQNKSIPIMLHLNAGRWGNDSGIMNSLSKDKRLTMWDIKNWDMYRSNDSMYTFMSYSRKNTKHYSFKKRNLQQAAKRLVDWRNSNPDLFIGVSLDSEDSQFVWDNTRYSDYNPMSIDEWKEWLQGTGIYDPNTGEYKGEAREQVFTSISDFNTTMGTSFSSWAQVYPPTVKNEGNALWEEWSRWKVMLLKHHLQDMTNWLIEAGLPANRIYSHQAKDNGDGDFYYLVSDIINTADLKPGSMGITAYGDDCDDTNFFKRMRGYNKNWGVPEYNPLHKDDKNAAYSALQTAYNNGAHYICPHSWFDTGIYEMKNTKFSEALQDFVNNYGDQRRPAQFDMDLAGTNIYDFYLSYGLATVTNCPSSANGSYSVGGVAKNSVFLHAPNSGDALATYNNIALPSLNNNERLNMVLYSGLADGADNSDGYIVKVLVNGNSVFTGNYAAPNYSKWHRWEPAMIDLTSYAGQTVNIALASNKGDSNSNYDWIVFGTPAIYRGTPDIAAPSQVGGLSAVNNGSHTIKLDWNRSSEQSVSEYKIYRSTTNSFTPSNDNFVAFSNKNCYIDTNLSTSTTYYYKISAVDEAGNEGAYSNQVSAVTNVNDTVVPGQVSGLTATVDSSKDSISLSWNIVSDTDMKEYRVYRSTKAGFTVDDRYLIAVVDKAINTYKDYCVLDGESYYYKIVSYDTNENCGSPSSQSTDSVSANTKTWGFDIDGNYEGWNIANDVNNTSVSSGTLNFSISGADPYITYTTNSNLRAKRYHYIKVRMRNQSSATSGQVFWTSNENSSFSGDQSAAFPIVANDTVYREYLVPIGNMYQYTGILQNLRLDINAASGNINIDYIKVIESPEIMSWEFNTSNDYEGWNMSNQIDSSSVSGGSLNLAVTNRQDPYIHSIDNLKITADSDQSVKVGMQNGTSCSYAKLFWITDTDTIWNENKSTTIKLNPNALGYTDYLFPVGSNMTYWTGTIKQLRLDPINPDGVSTYTGTINIDRIAVCADLANVENQPRAIPGNGKVTIYWPQGRNDMGSNNYNIYRSNSYDGAYTKINIVPANIYYEDTTVSNGNTYYYKIEFVNDRGNGVVSYSAAPGAVTPSTGSIATQDNDFLWYTQGNNNWYYQYYNGSSYANMDYNHVSFYDENDYWSVPAIPNNCRISPSKLTPDTGYEPALKWISPVNGTITLTGRPYLADQSRYQGDGVDLKIFKNSTQIWSSTLDSISYANEASSHNFTVNVNSGDVIYFRVNEKSNSTGDEVCWNPEIIY